MEYMVIPVFTLMAMPFILGAATLALWLWDRWFYRPVSPAPEKEGEK